MKKKIALFLREVLLFSILSVSFCRTSHALGYSDKQYSPEEFVVTPTRIEEKRDLLADDISVFYAEDLKKRGIHRVQDVLKQDTGIDVVQSGAFGGATSVFIRGANSGQTRFMIDGVHVYDPISVNGAFDPAFLTLDNVERVEVVKGPQSSLYGSDAIGGVVNILTKKGEGVPCLKIFSEGGSFDSYREGLEYSGQTGWLRFALGGSRFDTGGISSAASRLGNPERDGMNNTAYSARFDYDLSEALSLGYIGRYTYGRTNYDDSYTHTDDMNEWGWSRQILSSVFLEHKASRRFDHKIQISYTGNDRRDFDDLDFSHPVEYTRDWYYGSTLQASWQGNFKLLENDTVIAGIDYFKEKGESYYFSISSFGSSESVFPKRYASGAGYFIENRLNIGSRASASASYRIEDHSTFGTAGTYKINGVYRIPEIETRLRAGCGTGFKVPTLYQLYVPGNPDPFNFFGGGNASLKPEKSQTYEFGFTQPLTEKMSIDWTYFNNRFNNLIDAVYNPSTFAVDQYMNVNRAQSDGFESRLQWSFCKIWTLLINYTHMNTQDKQTGSELLRRAKNKTNVSLRCVPNERLTLNIAAASVSRRLDSGNIILKSYTKVDLSAEYMLNPDWIVYGRIDNLLDKRYEEVSGYDTTGFSFLAGIRVTF